jgi:hypothetical protein
MQNGLFKWLKQECASPRVICTMELVYVTITALLYAVTKVSLVEGAGAFAVVVSALGFVDYVVFRLASIFVDVARSLLLFMTWILVCFMYF